MDQITRNIFEVSSLSKENRPLDMSAEQRIFWKEDAEDAKLKNSACTANPFQEGYVIWPQNSFTF